jgi:Mg/Co/Ni transporter MgtE
MKAQELHHYIETNFVSVEPEHSIDYCIETLNNEQQKCVAILEEGKYIGSIHLEDLIGLELESKLKDFSYLYRNCAVIHTKTTLDFLRKFAEQETDQLFVLNEDHSILGSLSITDFLAFFRETPFLAFSGEEIVLQKKRVDFTYAEIAQIIEANGAKLLGIYTQYVDAEEIQICVRLDHNGMNEILQNLRRYDYEIISLHKEDQLTEKLKDYSDYFEKYLNI